MQMNKRKVNRRIFFEAAIKLKVRLALPLSVVNYDPITQKLVDSPDVILSKYWIKKEFTYSSLENPFNFIETSYIFNPYTLIFNFPTSS